MTGNAILLGINLFMVFILGFSWEGRKGKGRTGWNQQKKAISEYRAAGDNPDMAASGCNVGNRQNRKKSGTTASEIRQYRTVWGMVSDWLPEFAVYSVCMIRISDLIIQGIQGPGHTSRALFLIRILLAESMLFLFPLWKILCFEREYVFTDTDICHMQLRMSGQNCDAMEKAVSQDACERDRATVFQKDPPFFFTLFLLFLLALQGWQDTKLTRAFVYQLGSLFLFLGFEYLEERQKYRKCGNKYTRNKAGASHVPGTEIASEGMQRHRQAEYLKNVEQQYQRTRELWHDLKNHIKVLEILAEEERFGELTDYLDSFRRDVERRMIPMKTGCAAVDALLGDKLYLAGKQGTEMALQLCDLSEMRISAVDLCVILGNLLDNALEACALMPESSRIKLSLKQEEGFYYLKIVNTAREPVKEGEKYLSGKAGRDNKVGHGLGLRSAERIAHQYGGILVTDYSDGEFTVVVRLEAGIGGDAMSMSQ